MRTDITVLDSMQDHPKINRFRSHDDVQTVLGPGPGTSLVTVVKYLKKKNKKKGR